MQPKDRPPSSASGLGLGPPPVIGPAKRIEILQARFCRLICSDGRQYGAQADAFGRPSFSNCLSACIVSTVSISLYYGAGLERQTQTHSVHWR